ncbi:MAG: hypothetical protein ACM4D3_01100 [Candidatus Sericytochromatia bacterium]
MIGVTQPTDGNFGEHRVGFFTAAEPRKRMGANKNRSWTGSRTHCRFREPFGERQIPEPDRTVRGPDEEVRVGFEVGVQTQHRAAHHSLYVVAAIGFCEFAGNETAQPSQSSGCRAPAANLAVERMRDAHLDTAADGLERDEATIVRLFDGRRICDSPQYR